MRIYYLAHRIPHPPDKGEKIRAYHQLRHLARRHEVTLATHVEAERDRVSVAALEQWCRRVDWAPRPTGARLTPRLGRALASGRPLSFAAFATAALHAKVQAALERERYDLIFCYGAAMAPYVLDRRHTPRVIDFVDADSAKWRALAASGAFPLRPLYSLEAQRVARAEADILAELDQGIVACEGERDDLGRGARTTPPVHPVAVLGNGVDLDYFRPDAPDTRPIAEREPLVVFTGVMDYAPNAAGMLRFVREILPRVRRGLPATRLAIVGRNPSPAVRRLARVPGVEVTGEVPDVRPYLRRAAAAVVPLQLSRGVQNKLLEAAAMGLPAVVSARVAAGTALEPGRDLLVADDPEPCAAALTRILSDRPFAAALGGRARRAVELRHRWDPILERLEELIEGVEQRFSSARRRTELKG